MDDLRSIIFEFDGVIINSSADIANAVNATLDHFSLRKLPVDRLVSYSQDDDKILIARAVSFSVKESNLNASDFPAQELSTMLDWYRDYYKEHALECTMLYPDTYELLSAISSQSKFAGLVSNKSHELTESILAYFGIDDFFYSVIGADMVTKRKPNPECYITALNEINNIAGHLPGGSTFSAIAPTETLIVGESDSSISAGRAFGAHTCCVTGDWSTVLRPSTMTAEFTVKSAGELRGILAF